MQFGVFLFGLVIDMIDKQLQKNEFVGEERVVKLVREIERTVYAGLLSGWTPTKRIQGPFYPPEQRNWKKSRMEVGNQREFIDS